MGFVDWLNVSRMYEIMGILRIDSCHQFDSLSFIFPYKTRAILQKKKMRQGKLSSREFDGQAFHEVLQTNTNCRSVMTVVTVS